MRRCGTCWASLKDGEDVNDHAQTSQLHTEAVQLLEDRRAESLRSVKESLEGTEWVASWPHDRPENDGRSLDLKETAPLSRRPS